MKYATEKQVVEIATTYGEVYHDSTYGLAAIDANGKKWFFKRNIYRDTLHNLAKDGKLVFSGHQTYRKA